MPVRIAVFPEGGTLVEGVANVVYVLVTRADGSPVKANLRVTGIREDLKTDDRGAASFSITPKTRENRFTIRLVDEMGGPLAEQRQLLYCGDITNDFLVRTDKAVYRGGESMKLTALGAGSEPVFIDFIQNGKDGNDRVTLLSATIDVRNGQGDFTLDLPPELSGTLELCAYRLNDVGLAVRKSRVVYVHPAGDLHIKATLDRADYRPGDKARLNFLLTDSQGKPTAGAISLAGVDKAVFALLPQAPGMERSFFTLEQELLKPVFSLYPWTPMPAREGEAPAEPRRNFEQALFASTAANVAVPHGGPKIKEARLAPPASYPTTSHSLVVASYGKKIQETAELRMGRMEWVIGGWLGVLGFVLLTGYVSIWYCCSRSTVGKIHLISLVVLVPLGVFGLILSRVGYGDIAKSAAPGSSSPTLIFDQSESMPVGGGVGPLANGRFGFADGSVRTDVDREAAGLQAPGGAGEAGPAAEPAPRVRERFPETMLWEPILIADDNGRVKPLDFTLADSITEWRLTASAVSDEGKLGAVQLPLKVFQPFFVELNLPVALTRGDEVGIPVVVYNYLDKPQTVTLNLDDAGWFEHQGDAKLTLDLKPGEVRMTSYRIKVLRVGTQELLVKALGQGVGDALKRKIDVLPDGRRRSS